MSSWTYINGIVDVSPMGRTGAESRYILETVLNHLPIVWGSEDCMRVDIIDMGSSSSSSCDEFDQMYERPNIDGTWGTFPGWFDGGSHYKLIVSGSLRDTEMGDTYSAFIKWLTRLSKRCIVTDVMVEINDYWTSKMIHTKQFHDLYEDPSWGWGCGFDEDGFPESINWCEFLMWERTPDSRFPLELYFSRYYDEGVDAEMLRRYDYKYGKDRVERVRERDLNKARRRLKIKRRRENETV